MYVFLACKRPIFWVYRFSYLVFRFTFNSLIFLILRQIYLGIDFIQVIFVKVLLFDTMRIQGGFRRSKKF